MRRTLFLALAVTTAAVACSSAQVETDGTPQPLMKAQPAPTITNASVLPLGAALRVTLNHSLGLAGTRAGDRFYAMVIDPIVTTRSEVVIPAGATVSGRVLALPTASDKNIEVQFDQITFGGRTRLFAAEISNPAASYPLGATLTLRTTRELALR